MRLEDRGVSCRLGTSAYLMLRAVPYPGHSTPYRSPAPFRTRFRTAELSGLKSSSEGLRVPSPCHLHFKHREEMLCFVPFMHLCRKKEGLFP